MDNLFLPRDFNNIETGPQIFTGPSVLNTSVLFTKGPPLPDPPGLLNSLLIEDAGVLSLNGVFNYTVEFENKPSYNKNGDGNLFILWFNNSWQIYDFNISSVPIYFSSEDVLYPWNVTVWQSSNPIYDPAPTVTKVL
jgi:hypothetical protein